MARSKKDIADMYKSPFPTTLRALMSEAPVTTQEMLAEVTGKTRQTISQYVNGISEPGYDTLIRIADHFDVSIDYLLGRTNDRRKAPSMYDQIGLSEKSISMLKLVHEAKSNPSKFEELMLFMDKRSAIGFPHFQEEKSKARQLTNPTLAEQQANELTSNLAIFLDEIIEISTLPNMLIESYAELVNPNPRKLESMEIPKSIYVDFRAYQVSEIIHNYLRHKFIRIEKF